MPSAMILIAETLNAKLIVGLFPLAPHHDWLQYIHHIHLMQVGSKLGCYSINREWDSLFETHTHSTVAHEWDRSISHKGEREQLSEIIFVSLGFNFDFGSHSIFEENAGYSPLWFPQGKFFVSLVSCAIIVVHVILSDKILDDID